MALPSPATLTNCQLLTAACVAELTTFPSYPDKLSIADRQQCVADLTKCQWMRYLKETVTIWEPQSQKSECASGNTGA